MTEATLTTEGCRARQARLVAALEQHQLDLVVLTRSESINWLTGVYLGPLFEPAAAITADGQVTLALPEGKLDLPATADRCVGFAAKRHSTMRNDQRQASVAAVVEAVGSPRPRRVGAEFSHFVQHLATAWQADWHDIDPVMLQLRRLKHEDELAMMAHANRANRRMYERARELVAPGINELDLYGELHAEAVRTLGEPLTYFGQDFRCAARGGPPRDRQAAAGELYILDLGVGYRGYYSDNARTLAVGGQPTDLQQAAWQQLTEVFAFVEREVRPGVSCKALFEQVQQLLDAVDLGTFNHHLGHGVGLAPHEGPHLNPHWDDHFAEGDFFSVEPGLYDDRLQQGIRLEQNYVVTGDGVQLVTDWPLALV